MTHWRPPVRFGLGAVALGNGFAPMTEAQAHHALHAAWDAGIRYYDTSPFYGFGLSERRCGHFLHAQNRDAYTLSTKVGRIFTAGAPKPHPVWKDPSPFVYRYDYTADGVKRSLDDSLQRLGVDRIDIVFVHDLAPDNDDDLGGWKQQFAIAANGAFPALTKLREEGVIAAWGLGVNRIEPIQDALRVADPDICLLATQYSLANHERALHELFPQLEPRGVSIVVGAPFEAGFLSGKDRYDYGPTIPDDKAKQRARMAALAQQHGVDLRTAALQFAAAPSIVAAVIPGGRSPEQIRANVASMTERIPAAFWDALKREALIAADAPVPG
ncbi:MAG TPA: aldo/keto reductase [Kofleriaceae bacterium]|jgi:D-threo-aldose 1-dehydrogenase|nr:aldo/keto reductase [Kofleriaceae bacterium]